MARTMRTRSARGIRASFLAALRLIRIEQVTPDFIPVEDGVRGVTKPLQGHCEIVVVLQVAFQRFANHLRPASPELGRSGVQRFDHRPGYSMPAGDVGVK